MLFASSRVTTVRRNGVSFLMTSIIICSMARCEVVVGEAAAGLVEVVIEAVLDGRADGDLRPRKEPLHGVGHHVRGRVPDDSEAVLVGGANRGELAGRSLDGRMQVNRAAAELDGDDVLVELVSGSKDFARGLSFHPVGRDVIAHAGPMRAPAQGSSARAGSAGTRSHGLASRLFMACVVPATSVAPTLGRELRAVPLMSAAMPVTGEPPVAMRQGGGEGKAQPFCGRPPSVWVVEKRAVRPSSFDQTEPKRGAFEQKVPH